MTETKRLGRGLEALLGPITREEAAAAGALKELAVAAVHPNPFQPRREVDQAGLDELAASIAASGLLQPIVVRPRPRSRPHPHPHADPSLPDSPGGGYEIIAGERRWRAVRQLGWAKVPAVVREVEDQALLTLALVENLQRDDLSPMDEARGYQRLLEEFRLSQNEVARLVGRNRATVANCLRLLALPPDVQDLIQRGALSEGQARALLGLREPAEISRLAGEVVAHGWSVRETEALVRGEGRAAEVARPKLRARRAPVRRVHAEHRRVEDTLRRHLGTDVRVTAKRRGRGTVSISYYSADDLARLLELILGAPFDG